MSAILTYIHRMNEAQDLINYAMDIAKELDKDLDILYSLELQSPPMGIPGTAKPNYETGHGHTENILSEINKELDSIIERTRNHINDPPEINHFTEEGITHHIVRDFVLQNKYDYVIVSADTQNERLINDRNMDIIKNVACPVLVITEKTSYRSFKKIIYATDYEQEDIQTLIYLADFAKNSDAEIIALHVDEKFDPGEKSRKTNFMKRLNKEVGYENIDLVTRSQEKEKSLPEIIYDFARQHDADLIAVMKKEKGFFAEAFRKSETKKIMNISDLPVLIFQEK